MILIWGVKIRLKQLRSVMFACPRCGADRHGDVMQARRWFTAFFLPLVPLKHVGTLVRCRVCLGQFTEAVLDIPTTATASEHLGASLRHAAAAMVRASANAPAARAAAIDVVAQGGVPFDEEQLDIDLAGSRDAQTIGWLQHMSTVLSPHGKELLLGRVASIAYADGDLDERERSLLEEMGAALDMTTAHVAGLLTQVAAERRAPEV